MAQYNYKRMKELGRGTAGVVYLVRDRDDNSLWVEKEVDMSDYAAADFKHAMVEVTVLSAFNHPYIVGHRESWVDSGAKLHIVMTYASNGELEERIQSRKKTGKFLRESQIWTWFIQMLLALKHIHDRQTLHRDIKTQNIFLDDDENAVVGDFGLATVLTPTLGFAQSRLGTPYYLSPEICEGHPYNSKSDVWALGCVVFKMCALQHAFQAPNISELIQTITDEEPRTIPTHYTSKLQRIIEKMLVKDMASRPSVDDILRNKTVRALAKKYLDEDMYLQLTAPPPKHKYTGYSSSGSSSLSSSMTGTATVPSLRTSRSSGRHSSSSSSSSSYSPTRSSSGYSGTASASADSNNDERIAERAFESLQASYMEAVGNMNLKRGKKGKKKKAKHNHDASHVRALLELRSQLIRGRK